MTDLGTPPGYSFISAGIAINDSGQVAGYSNRGPETVLNLIASGFLYSNGQMTALGTVGEGRNQSPAYGINDAGQVVGWSDSRSCRSC